MAIYALGDLTPAIHPDAYVHPDATIIGAVTVHAEASVWPQAVLRGDYGTIEVRARTSVQDGSVIHCTQFHPVVIGEDCVVGHNVHIEGATIGARCLIASGSVVLNGAVVEDGAVVGAGAVVSFNGHVAERTMVLGIPARVREGHEVPADMTSGIVATYVANAKTYQANLRRVN